MELRQLRYFVTLAEELHFGRAAQRLAISQPPLSYNIRQLEQELGVRLFERDSKRVVLTAAGAAFLAEARHILAQTQRARETAHAVGKGRLGRLEIGFTASMPYRGMPAVLTAFSQEHPGIEVMLRELSSSEQNDALLHGRLDAGFINALRVPEGLEGDPLNPEPFVCCVPELHPAARLRVIDLAKLEGEPFVMFSRDASPSNYQHVISICAAAGYQPEIRCEAQQWLTIAALVANGLGVALVPRAVADARIGGVRFVPLKRESGRALGFFVWNPAHVMPGLPFFIATARSELAAASTRGSKVRKSQKAV